MSERKIRKIRVLVAKPGLDGHDVGAKVVVRALADAGFEVIYSGLQQTPEAICAQAREEDVDVIGLSMLSGSHLPLCRKIGELLSAEGLGEKLWLVGGNIPARDFAALNELGYAGVFATGSDLDEIASFIREKLS
jgi:methylmalonyl-CoA mutase C-terminal domain/subunit